MGERTVIVNDKMQKGYRYCSGLIFPIRVRHERVGKSNP
jgi:hypothetical protein